MSVAPRRIGLSAPWLDEREEELVLEVLRSGRLSLGPWIDRFEEEFAAAVGAPYAAAVSSGTAGLHLLCVAASIAPGDEVITSPYSFVASANCAIYEGAVPVFADIDPRTLNLDPAAVAAAITPRTKAIVAVDIFGYPSEMDELQAIAEKHGLALIDDSCEALGARYKQRPLGAQGQDAVWAFYPEQADHDRRGRRRDHVVRGRRGGSSRASGTRAAPTAGAGSTMRGSGSTTASTTSGPRSASASSRSSTGSWPAAPRSPLATQGCSRTSTASGCRARTTPTTSGRGSCTSSSFRKEPTANA